MRVVFRTDASLCTGHGHVMRCLTLASALSERGAAISFVCREHDGHLCDLVEERGFAVSRLPGMGAVSLTEDHSADAPSPLGSTWHEDAEQTFAAITASGIKPDWLVVDHYALDQRWESALRPSVWRIMVIDDLADRLHDCDLLLDQNLVAHMHTRYADKVPAACSLLLGPEYALLQPIYAELRNHIRPRKGPIHRIFIFFGGSDNDNLTGRSLAAFLRLNRSDIQVDVVITANCPHEAAIREQTTGHSNIHVHRGLPTLAPLIAKADLGIGASGATSWERLCLGLPTLVVTLADNQRPIAAHLHARRLVHWIGNPEQADEQTIHETLARTLDLENGNCCLRACTGHGVSRVLPFLTPATG